MLDKLLGTDDTEVELEVSDKPANKDFTEKKKRRRKKESPKLV